MFKKLPLGLLLISPFSALAHPHAFIDMQTKPLVKDNQLIGFSTQWLLDEASSSAVLYDVKQAKGDKAAQQKLVDEVMANVVNEHYFSYVFDKENHKIKYTKHPENYGMRTVADIRRLLNAGADKASINTAAVTNPDLVNEAAGFFGSQAIVVAVDAKAVNPENTRWEIFTHGGRNPTGLDAVEWAVEMQRRGAGEILLTSMDRDGTKQGFNLPLTRAVSEAVDIPVIASGGVGSVQHLVDGIKEGKADAVLAASIFHFGEASIREAKLAMREAGIEVRL